MKKRRACKLPNLHKQTTRNKQQTTSNKIFHGQEMRFPLCIYVYILYVKKHVCLSMMVREWYIFLARKEPRGSTYCRRQWELTRMGLAMIWTSEKLWLRQSAALYVIINRNTKACNINLPNLPCNSHWIHTLIDAGSKMSLHVVFLYSTLASNFTARHLSARNTHWSTFGLLLQGFSSSWSLWQRCSSTLWKGNCAEGCTRTKVRTARL